MKRIVIPLVLLAMTAAPAAAWLAPQGEWAAAIAAGVDNLSPAEAARLKCFQDAPWVVPPGYYQSCLARAGRVK